MNELYELLDGISRVLWVFYAASLVMFYHVSKKIKNVRSSFIVITIIFVANSIMFGYQELLDWYIEGHPGYNPVVNFCWYVGFASLNIIAMKALYIVHKKENVKIGTLGQLVNVAFFTLVCIQLAQYADNIIFKTNQHIIDIYTVGIPTINIATTTVCFSLALVAIYHIHISKKGLEGLKRWTI
jgi:hypothetical protein